MWAPQPLNHSVMRFLFVCPCKYSRYRSFLFGYDAGVMTDVIASKNFLAFFHTTSDSAIIGAINSTFNGGAVFGALQGGLTMDRCGRKLTILMGALICLAGAILQCAAQDLAMILVGRIFTGWAVGLLSMAVPVYNSECADPKIRGLIVGLSQQMIGVGFIVYAPSLFLTFETNSDENAGRR
jgi:MFS family permease